MSILVKGMDMPKGCSVCKLFGEYGCPFIGAVGYEQTRGERSDDCPLDYVPPHGDLVDLKAPFKAQYYDEMTEEWVVKEVTVEDVLYGCMVDGMPPTIIPAEEGEK